MNEPLINRDHRGETQTSLFPAPSRCPACQAGARNACTYDADLASGDADNQQRPNGCLNQSAQLLPDEDLPF